MSVETEVLASATAANPAYTEGLEYRIRDRLRIHRLRNGKRSLANRLALGLALAGPGILVMLGDNDAGGVITYAQTGATYGLSLFVPLMIPLAFIAYLVQEMTIRLGAVTRRGHAEMIWKRYGKFWGAFSLVDLVAANILTLMTEFIGVRVASEIFGLPYLLTIPVAFAFCHRRARLPQILYLGTSRVVHCRLQRDLRAPGPVIASELGCNRSDLYRAIRMGGARWVVVDILPAADLRQYRDDDCALAAVLSAILRR